MKPEIVGEHPRVRALLRDAEALASLRSPVLITGETGTGKDLVARYIHELGGGSSKSFRVVDCGCLTEEMARSELFGHTRGAFTGAHADKEGLLGSLRGGTVFLDEVCEVSTPLQLQLLRLLETGEFRRVGGTATSRLEARILMATNRDIDSDVSDGTIRKDSYYRVSGLRLEVPPLRLRLSDIPLLTDHFLRRLEVETGKACRVVPEFTEALLQNPWKGNIRELHNYLRIAVFRSTDGVLRVENSATERGDIDWTTLPYRQARTRIHKEGIRRYVETQLDRTARNVTQAASLSGVSRQYFQKLMAEVGVRRSTLAVAPTRID